MSNFWWGGGWNFTFHISHFSHIQTLYQHTLHFYATTLINHKKVWTQWKIRTN